MTNCYEQNNFTYYSTGFLRNQINYISKPVLVVKRKKKGENKCTNYVSIELPKSQTLKLKCLVTRFLIPVRIFSHFVLKQESGESSFVSAASPWNNQHCQHGRCSSREVPVSVCNLVVYNSFSQLYSRVHFGFFILFSKWRGKLNFFYNELE